ncbi:hypothetical protein K438DRAFT_1526881, partial [Mycena galopus ATCC 62051]
IRDYIHTHKTLISYPRRPPRELIEKIFLLCLPIEGDGAMSPSEAPLLLCRI